MELKVSRIGYILFEFEHHHISILESECGRFTTVPQYNRMHKMVEESRKLPDMSLTSNYKTVWCTTMIPTINTHQISNKVLSYEQ